MFKYKDVFNLKLLDNVETVKPFDLPVLKAVQEIPKQIVAFNFANSYSDPENAFVHFYIDDYQFERLWNRPEYYAKKLSRFKGVIAPDYSTYTNMPVAQQIYQVYKSRLIGAYLSSLGITVIPNISWSDEKSLDWSLAGIPKHSVVALSTNGVLNSKVKQNFINCYNKAMAELEPTAIVIVGEVPEEIASDKIIQFNNHINSLRKIKKELQ